MRAASDLFYVEFFRMTQKNGPVISIKTLHIFTLYRATFVLTTGCYVGRRLLSGPSHGDGLPSSDLSCTKRLKGHGHSVCYKYSYPFLPLLWYIIQPNPFSRSSIPFLFGITPSILLTRAPPDLPPHNEHAVAAIKLPAFCNANADADTDTDSRPS